MQVFSNNNIGKCVLACPSPYFHSISSNNKGRCVLNCEEGAFLYQQSRVCTCNNINNNNNNNNNNSIVGRCMGNGK